MLQSLEPTGTEHTTLPKVLAQQRPLHAAVLVEDPRVTQASHDPFLCQPATLRKELVLCVCGWEN